MPEAVTMKSVTKSVCFKMQDTGLENTKKVIQKNIMKIFYAKDVQ